MSNGTNGNRNLGLVRPFFPRAEIVEIKSDANGDWAIFRVPVGYGDNTQLVQVYDNREETVDAARKALEVSTQYYNARGAAKTAMDAERIQTLKDVRAALNSGEVEAVIGRNVVGGGRKEKLTIALYPNETGEQASAVLAMVHTTGRYDRYPSGVDERPLSFVKGPRGKMVFFHLHLVYSDGEPIYIWQLDHNAPMLFKVSRDGGLEVRAFQSVELEEAETVPAAPIPVKAEETDVVPAGRSTRKKAERSPKAANGKTTTVECPRCEQPRQVDTKLLATGGAQCPKCHAVLEA